MERTIKRLNELLQEAKKDLKRYESFIYYKQECINNINIHINLLKEELKDRCQK